MSHCCTAFDGSFSSFRKAAEHPPVSAALLQGGECSEAGFAGRGQGCWLHRPLCGCKHQSSFSHPCVFSLEQSEDMRGFSHMIRYGATGLAETRGLRDLSDGCKF